MSKYEYGNKLTNKCIQYFEVCAYLLKYMFILSNKKSLIQHVLSAQVIYMFCL